jgi:hypothetical protein
VSSPGPQFSIDRFTDRLPIEMRRAAFECAGAVQASFAPILSPVLSATYETHLGSTSSAGHCSSLAQSNRHHSSSRGITRVRRAPT